MNDLCFSKFNQDMPGVQVSSSWANLLFFHSLVSTIILAFASLGNHSFLCCDGLLFTFVHYITFVLFALLCMVHNLSSVRKL